MQVLALSMEEVVETSHMYSGGGTFGLQTTISASEPALSAGKTENPLPEPGSLLQSSPFRVSFKDQLEEDRHVPLPTGIADSDLVAEKRKYEEKKTATSGNDYSTYCSLNQLGDSTDAVHSDSAQPRPPPAHQTGWRKKNSSRARRGVLLRGRCQCMLQAVRVELRRRAWAALAGQARLQVGNIVLHSVLYKNKF